MSRELSQKPKAVSQRRWLQRRALLARGERPRTDAEVLVHLRSIAISPTALAKALSEPVPQRRSLAI